MLNRIILKNFQAHRDLSIRLRPGLNIITGSSDIGKSAIVRAIRFLSLHETASGLTSHGQTDMCVTLCTETNNVVRFKNQKEYGYRLDGEKFLACARDQPIPITTALNLTPENCQSQHDPHFLLSLTPGQVAKEINRIVALSDIDRSLGWLKERIRSTNTLLQATETELVGIQDYLTANEHIPQMGDMLTSLRTGHTEHSHLESTRVGLVRLIDELMASEILNQRLATKTTACEAALTQGKSLRAARHTKHDLESILIESKAIAALPQLEAVGAAVGDLIAQGLHRSALNGLCGMLSDTDFLIFSKKSKITTLLNGFADTIGARAVKSKQIRDLVNQLEDIQNEVDQQTQVVINLEQTLALRAACSKCGRKF